MIGSPRGRLLEHEPLLDAARARPGAWGSSGPGPVEAHIEHTRGVPRRARRRSTGTRRRPGQRRAGCPGWSSAWPGPTSSCVLVDATAKRCRFLEEAVAAPRAATPTVVEGRAEVLGHGPAAGHGRRGGGPELRPARPPPPSAPRPCCGSAAGSSSASRRTGDRTAGRPTALAELGLEVGAAIGRRRPVVQVLSRRRRVPTRYPRRDGLPAKRPLF